MTLTLDLVNQRINELVQANCRNIALRDGLRQRVRELTADIQANEGRVAELQVIQAALAAPEPLPAEESDGA